MYPYRMIQFDFAQTKCQDCNQNTNIYRTRWRQLGTHTWWWAVCPRGTGIGTLTRSPRWRWIWWQPSDRSPSLTCPTRGCSSEPASTQVRGARCKMEQVKACAVNTKWSLMQSCLSVQWRSDSSVRCCAVVAGQFSDPGKESVEKKHGAKRMILSDYGQILNLV